MESLLSGVIYNTFKSILNGANISIEGARPVVTIVLHQKAFPKSRVA